MKTDRLCCHTALVTLVVLAGCASTAPAPVEDRSPRAAAASPKAAPLVSPAAQIPAPAPPPDTYIVKRGDTLYSIALDHGVDWREIAAWNQLADPTRLPTGQALRVRPPPDVVVSPITGTQPIVTRPLGSDAGAIAPSPPGIAAPRPTGPAAGLLKVEPKGIRLPYSDENLALLQRGDQARVAVAPRPDAPPAAQPKPEPAAKPGGEGAEDRVEWAWPAAGKVLATFNGTASKGVDIAGRVGDPVYASAAGKVVYSGEGIPAYGKLVIVRHNNTYLSAYAHNSQILVKEGQAVAKGQKIAEVGSIGSDPAKLHFEIRRLGKPVDPLQYLPSRSH